MRTKSLRNLYQMLTPEERFRLVLEAMKRGDQVEVQRLSETCPQEVYLERDRDFTALVEASHDVARAFTMLWLDFSRHMQAANSPEAALKWTKALRGLWRGLSQFCEDHGLEPEALLAWNPPIVEEIKALGDLLEQEPIDTRALEETYLLFTDIWPCVKRTP